MKVGVPSGSARLPFAATASRRPAASSSKPSWQPAAAL